MVCPSLSDTERSWQVSAGEGGTCARGLRILTNEHSMIVSSVSNPRVRPSSSTNTQGLPLHRLTILPSQSSSTHVPWRYCSTSGVESRSRTPTPTLLPSLASIRLMPSTTFVCRSRTARSASSASCPLVRTECTATLAQASESSDDAPRSASRVERTKRGTLA